MRNNVRPNREKAKALGSTTQSAGPLVIVTGASSGIGRALALRLGAEGYRVGLIARRRDELEAATATITAAGGAAVSAVADVGDRACAPSGRSPLSRAGSDRRT